MASQGDADARSQEFGGKIGRRYEESEGWWPEPATILTAVLFVAGIAAVMDDRMGTHRRLRRSPCGRYCLQRHLAACLTGGRYP